MKLNKRNMASAIDTIMISGNQALWTDWTISKAVNDGYKSSAWVYKAISLISRNGASVPFVVKDKNDEIEWEHPITKLLLNPHPFLNRLSFYELLIQWLQLTGNAYLKKANGLNETKELWVISPDRIAPIESKDNISFLDGYEIKLDNGATTVSKDFTTETVIHFALTDPSNPLKGISPLQACARAVDSDISQQDWNVSANQNRGVVDGVFTFKKDLDKTQSDSILQRIMDKFSGKNNARKPLVIGSEAQYTRLSLTATEMDFMESRKFNRDEIFIAFGVPPQLGGSQESSTYNNFSESMRIFWLSTIIPLLDIIATQFTNSFEQQLDNGRYIGYDLSNVEPLRDNEIQRAEVAKIYFDMGVPLEEINEKLELGFDLTNVEKPMKDSERGLVLIEKRNYQEEILKREDLTKKASIYISDLLERQSNDVLKALENNENPKDAVMKYDKELGDLITDIYLGTAQEFAETVVSKRNGKLDWNNRGEEEDALINEYLLEGALILEEKSLIQRSTINMIMEQVVDAEEKGYTYNTLRQSIYDTGVFSPERALRIARTEIGTASSIGQMSSAKVAGATHKTWRTSGINTRPIHIARDGEQVRFNEKYSLQVGVTAPRFPSDPRIDVSDRVNCDCFQTFSIED